MGTDHLGWAAKIIGFHAAGKKVKLQVTGESAYTFPVSGSALAFDKFTRLT